MMQRVTIEFMTKDHPQRGPIGVELGNLVLSAVYSVYSRDLARGTFKIEPLKGTDDPHPGTPEDSPAS